LRGCGKQLLQPQTWCFLICFSWAGTCAAWALGGFRAVAAAKATAQGPPGASRTLEALVALQPVLANATFIFAPCLGAVIDAFGFAPAAALLGLSVVLLSSSLWLLPLAGQWLTLVLLNLLQAVTYTVQLSYIAKVYPSGMFGSMMSLSTLVQSAFNPLSIYVVDLSLGSAALLFLAPALPACLAWAAVQHRLRIKGIEFAQ